MDRHVRSFDAADDLIEMAALRSELVNLGPLTVARTLHHPGWRWSELVRPVTGTEWCTTRHVGYAIGGHLHVVLADGGEFDVEARMVYDIPAGHDGWVVGDEPFESVEWMGARTWLPTAGMSTERILATLVMTDLVGSTAAANRLGPDGWSELIGAYEHAARDAIGRFRGLEVKLTGDGILAMFDGAGRAIRCGVALRSLAAELGLGSRTAIHTGEVEPVEGDLHGVPVHETARMVDLAEPGEVVVSATTRGLVADAGFELADRGTHELRGFAGVRQLFTVAGLS